MATTVINNGRLNVAAFQWSILALLFGLYYGPVVPELIKDWYEHSTFSYGFLVPFIAAYLFWQQWSQIKTTSVLPDIRASIPLFVAVAIGVAGYALGDSFSTRVSMILSLGSIVMLVFGIEMLKKLLFPLFYLSLMIPVPYVFIKDLTFYLRYSDATNAANVLQVLGLPVYRESYFLHIPNMSLEVADVCSGVSSVFALFALGVFYAHFLPLRFSLKILLVVCTFPFAVAANLFRIILTVILAYYFGPVVFQSYFHGFSGTFTFVLALMMTIGVGEILKRKFPVPSISVSMLDKPIIECNSGGGKIEKMVGWGAFAFGAVILSTALYSSFQFNAAPAIHLMTDLKAVDPGDDYKRAGTILEDAYQDSNAETSFSQVFVGNDGNTIDLFIGYRSSQTAGSRLRSPKLYLPERWNSAWLKPAELPVDERTSVRGNWMLARKGDSGQLVIYWYQIGSRTYAGEFEYRYEQFRRSLIERRSDGAVIRIASSLRNGESPEVAQARLGVFGVHLYRQLVRVLSSKMQGHIDG